MYCLLLIFLRIKTNATFVIMLNDWKKCIICQTSNPEKGHVVYKPKLESYQKLLDVVNVRAKVNESEFISLWERLKDNTKETLSEKPTIWHRTCYSNATNKTHTQRAKDQLQCYLQTGSYRQRGKKRKSAVSLMSTNNNFNFVNS